MLTTITVVGIASVAILFVGKIDIVYSLIPLMESVLLRGTSIGCARLMLDARIVTPVAVIGKPPLP